LSRLENQDFSVISSVPAPAGPGFQTQPQAFGETTWDECSEEAIPDPSIPRPFLSLFPLCSRSVAFDA